MILALHFGNGLLLKVVPKSHKSNERRLSSFLPSSIAQDISESGKHIEQANNSIRQYDGQVTREYQNDGATAQTSHRVEQAD